jgi:hypothetical protein
MSLTSEFYLGDLEAIVGYALSRSSGAPQPDRVTEVFSLSTHGISSREWLFASDLEDIADELAVRSGKQPSGLKRYRAQLLHGEDGPESEFQLLQLNDCFLNEFANLPLVDANQIAETLISKENARRTKHHHASLANLRRKVFWPFRSALDYLALVIGVLFPITLTNSVSSGLLYGVAFIILVYGIVSFNLSRKLRRLKQMGPYLEKRPITAMIASLTDFCKRARSNGNQVVYEWSV